MQARVLSDFTRNGVRFVTKAVPTHTKAHGAHIRVEHRVNGRVVSQRASLDAFRAADPGGYQRA